ncbi:MAG: ADP-ribosylglycohydrolase family protein [Aeromicrobium sp.]|uniref:ADP-ribosylglycohydrolase family protein n=1 Tax=Aeromicrobium sp. TaxID=1871063 RepID=UPI0039E5FCD2
MIDTDRAAGVLLGAAVGDALGAGYEFGSAPLGDAPPAMIGGGLGNFAPGEWTDDTAMTWAVADVAASGVDLRSEAALDAVALRFRQWYESGPPDIGIQTQRVLGLVGREPTGRAMAEAARSVHERIGRSGGNGSLMRTSPVALAHLDDPAALAEAARAVSGLTHHDPEAADACVLWCLGIRHAALHDAFDLRSGLAWVEESRRALWEQRIDTAETESPSTFRPNGWVVTAFQAAWSSVVQTPDTGSHLTDALHTAIRIGDDTDTVASIAGAMLGARWGASAIPAEWLAICHGYPGLTAEDLRELALRIVP